MAKTIKLPADLRDWKVTSFVGEDNGYVREVGTYLMKEV